MNSPDDKKRWIRPLPERLINKIAAGEVVERPASIVKELVENSLDAGADRVDIVVEKSGTRLIKIVDNGCGIGEDQIEIAFSRHATSKISEFEDLDRIMSYGFRGEALPSIASVSRMRMVSRPPDADTGIEIIYEGGLLQTKNLIAAAVGTTIEVENLFFNTPARRKFLKAETTEARHVTRTSMALAMGRYEIGFSAQVNGRKVFSLPSGLGLGDRVAGLLAPGQKFVSVVGELGPIRVEGFISPPDLARSNRNGQFIFINGRYVQSPTLAHAFAAGYGELMPRGNFPIGALLLTVEPAEVDVNVHPAKTEVRLSREREIHDALYRLIKESVRQQGVIPKMSLPGGFQPSAPTARAGSTDNRPPVDNQNAIPGITRPMPTSAGQMKEIFERTPTAAPSDGPAIVQVDTSTGEIISEQPAPDSGGAPQSLQFIGRFNNLYLLFQSGGELLIVDQHTAHERVLFEDMLRQMNGEGGLAQHLLLPVQVELGAEQMTLFDEALATLNRSGFEVSPFGGQTVRIEATPAVLSRKSPEKSFLAVMDDIASLKKSGYDLNKAIAQSIACRSAVMAGDRLADKEAMSLVDSLLKCENRYSCPHGRPTFIKMSREDLDKQFGRG